MARILILAALPLAACSPAQQQAAENTEAAVANAVDAMAAAEAPKSPAKAYVDMTAAADTYEKAAGTLAKEKGSSKAVRDYGKLLYDEHVQFTMELKMAAAKVPGLLPNPTMTAAQTADIAALQAASGAAFDALFLRQMRAHHAAMLGPQQAFAKSGEDGELTGFADRYARWVQRHIRLAPGG